ncbi:hypothetical protein ACJ73_08973 [Blastomyces percursus]|uniref:Uncharacterized protein n=1 Tax=Blastomyces percursus TaxID=1658174 RepID=A0A1J9QH97_9EURO|nr:hypothetical protein ACJ73_08973 [Blastomyces percursus]
MLPPDVTLRIGGVGGRTHSNRQFALIKVPMRSRQGHPVSISGQFHIIPDLPCPMLIANDILSRYNVGLFPGEEIATFGPHHVHASTRNNRPTRKPPSSRVLQPAQDRAKKIAVRSSESRVVEPSCGVLLAIQHRQFSNDLYFQPHMIHDRLSHAFTSAPHCLVSPQTAALPVSNFGDTPIRIPKGRILGYASPLPDNAPYDLHTTILLAQPVESDSTLVLHSASRGDETAPRADEAEIGNPFELPDQDRTSSVAQADISLDWGPEVCMPIPFKDEKDFSGLKQNPYRMSAQDKQAMDGILDPLKDSGRIEDVPLNRPSPVASPAFVVWRNGKPRVVIDLRRVNSKDPSVVLGRPRVIEGRGDVILMRGGHRGGVQLCDI